MESDDSHDLIFKTYFMVDWNKVKQAPSDDACVRCGRPMLKVEPLVADYGGRVCHNCKVVFWVKGD